MSIIYLSPYLINKICQNLNIKDVVNLSLTCKTLKSICNEDSIWNIFCKRYEIEKSKSLSSYEIIKEWYNRFGRYECSYIRMKKLIDRIKSVFHDICPDLYDSLNEGSSSKWDLKIFNEFDELSLLYLFIDGQFINESTPGLFGHYYFDDSFANRYLNESYTLRSLSLTIKKIYNKRVFPFVTAHSDISSYYAIAGEEMFDVYERRIEKGSVICYDKNFKNIYYLSDSLYNFINDYIDNVENGRYDIDFDNNWGICGINLFIDEGYKNEKEGVKINVKKLFVPGYLSDKFFFAYKIIIMMDEDEDERKSCQIVSSYYECYDGEKKKTYYDDDEFGEFPIIRPGTVYENDRWILIKSFKGTMGGHYIMRNIETDELMDIKIPTFELNVPGYKKEIIDRNDDKDEFNEDINFNKCKRESISSSINLSSKKSKVRDEEEEKEDEEE